ncbi:MAG TPA: MASE1 domain-containing protein [Candidatus Binatia bacterium]|nr:MASE1 domain-containing protein [Candidatus Binatia bacterium]
MSGASPPPTSRGRAAAILLGTAAVYFVGAKVGLSVAFVAEQVTLVWPPTGIALVAMLLLGRRWTAPGIALGAFLANATTNEPLLTAAGIAAGNTLEALVGVWLLELVEFRPALDRLRDVLALMLLAAAFSTTVSATIGVASLCLGGVQPWSAFGSLWGVWWVGDALADLVVAPFVLVWTGTERVHLEVERRAEAALVLVATVAAGFAVFVPSGAARSAYPLQYAVFPLVVWGALRFGQRGTATVTFVTALLAVWGTVQGSGPFSLRPGNESLLMLQLFMGVVAATGLLLGAAITERDVARQRAAAEYDRVVVSEERLRLALDAGRMGVWDWNILSGEVTWTENLAPIHGLAPGDFPGTIEGFDALVHPEDRERVRGAIARAVEDATGYEVEFRNPRPDGTIGWISGKGHVLHDASGRAVRMIGVGLDVTHRRRLEEQLRERARDLAEADRRKDEFLAMLAHELRNPLAPLSAALHLLATDAGGRERFLAMAGRQVKQLVRLVDDLLDVSRITQGKITLRREPTTVEEVVGRAVETARPLIDSRGHAFTLSLPPDPVRLDADPARLAQVIANLLGNAAKYTPPGGAIWLTADHTDDEVVIRVRDTGAGLAPDLLPHVFDVFVQGDRALDRTRGGLGIGLTIVRRLVELHGGRVEAHSPGLGKGSEFVVHLPARPVSLPEAPLGAPGARSSTAAGLKVLVVEDNQDAAEGLAAVLGLWGHDVRLAFDGAAALEAAESWSPDVIVSDLGLPGMDGYELARRLRERPAFGKAVLVALSGYGQAEDRRRALDAGFDHHLVKPADLAALADILSGVAAGPAERPSRTVH